MLAGKTCGNCGAFSALTKECRRKAPAVVILQKPGGEPTAIGIFPGTTKGHWCCEWLADEKSALQ